VRRQHCCGAVQAGAVESVAEKVASAAARVVRHRLCRRGAIREIVSRHNMLRCRHVVVVALLRRICRRTCRSRAARRQAPAPPRRPCRHDAATQRVVSDGEARRWRWLADRRYSVGYMRRFAPLKRQQMPAAARARGANARQEAPASAPRCASRQSNRQSRVQACADRKMIPG